MFCVENIVLIFMALISDLYHSYLAISEILPLLKFSIGLLLNPKVEIIIAQCLFMSMFSTGGQYWVLNSTM
jgi:hypothetical protein